MKLRSIFYILFFFVCAFMPFDQLAAEIPIYDTKPCVRLGDWQIGQSSGYGNTIGTSFITNSEETCCVKVSVAYCKTQPSTLVYPLNTFVFTITMNNGFEEEKKVERTSGPDKSLLSPDTTFSVDAKLKGPKDTTASGNDGGLNGRGNTAMSVTVTFTGYYGSDPNNQKTVTLTKTWTQDEVGILRQEYVDMTPPVKNGVKRAEMPVPGRGSFVPELASNGNDDWNTGHFAYMANDSLKAKKAAWLAEVNAYRSGKTDAEGNALSAFTDADFVVTNAYRSPYHNRFHVGGSFHSRHCYGDALDVGTIDVDGDGKVEQKQLRIPAGSTEEEEAKIRADALENSDDGELMEDTAIDAGAGWTGSWEYYSTHTHADWTPRSSWPPPAGTVYHTPCPVPSDTTTPPTALVPSSPHIFGVFLGDQKITLLWRAPASDGGSAILDYEYRYKVSGATEWVVGWTPAGANTSEKVSGLTPGTSYTIEVRAKNGIGYSVASAPYAFTTLDQKTVPGVPLSLSAVGGNGAVQLSWLPPADDGGSTITDYQYRYGTGESVTVDNYTDWVSTHSSVTSHTVSPLTNAMYHIFEVRAVNAKGYSESSASASATPRAPSAPGQPTDVTPTVSNGTVTLKWNAPEDTGSGIDTYQYRIDPNNDGSWEDWEDLDTSNTSATLTLQNGRVYGIQVRAKNSVGNSPHSTKVTAAPVDPNVTPPSAPRTLRASAENGQVRLSWNAPSTGTPVIDYEYKYDTNDDGSWKSWRVTDSTTTSYTVTGLTNETLYAFKVRARNTGGAGSHSSKVTATPTSITVPTKPRNLTASLKTNGNIRISWSAPADTGGSPITQYHYKIDKGNNGSWEQKGNTTHTYQEFTGSENGVTYAFKVYAINKIGTGPASNKATLTIPALPPPGVPQHFSASAGNAAVLLSWSAPQDDGGGTITYQYRYGISGGFYNAWSDEQSGTSATISGLSNGSTYYFQLRAKNSGGTSPTVTASATPTYQTVPGVPLSLSAISGDRTVTLSWLPPADTGNAPITHYQYQHTAPVWVSMGSALSAYTVRNLTNGTRYTFRVRAVNAIGSSDPSNDASATPVKPTIPGQPTDLTTTSSNGTVTLNWKAPTNNGGGIDTYQYRIDENNDGSWGDWEDLNSAATSATLTLQNGRDYGVQVRAKNSMGTGTQTTKSVAMPRNPSVSPPSAPRNLTATAENGQVQLSWNAPATGTPVIEYEYKYDTDNDGSWRTWKITGSTTTSYTVSGLTNGTTYAFKIRARNTGGPGSDSTSVTATPIGITVPSAPRNLTVAGVDRTTVWLDWDAPADDGGSAITTYRYHIDTHNDGTWEELGSLNSTSTSVYLYRFTPGETYAFMISAVNDMGAGTTSNKAVITMQGITPPSAPQYLTAEPGNASVYLSWSYPADDGDGYIDYQYRYRQSGGTWNSWSAQQWQSYVTVDALTNNTSYDFEVVATNEAGMGAAATVSATPTGTAVPGVPTYFSTHAENGAVDLWWDPPEFDGGSTITDYEYNYRQSGGSWNGWASAGNANVELPEYLVTGLTNGTTYQFKVRARNAVGPGESTGALSETPQAKKPDTPTGLSATAGSTTGTVELTWTAPNDNGSAITGYHFAYGHYQNNRWIWTKYTATGSTNTDYTVTGLQSGTHYRFRIVATNSIGNSSSSRYAQATAP